MSDCGNDTVVFLVETLGPRDSLGVRTKTYPPHEQPGCSVEKFKRSELVGNIDLVNMLRKVYAPPSALVLSLTASDKVQWMGDTYQIDGDIDAQTDLDGVIDHVYIEIRRTGNGGDV